MQTQGFPIPPHITQNILPRPKQQKIRFVNPNTGNYERNIKNAAELHKAGIPMIERNSYKGKTAIIVGSGPTLRDPKVLKEIERKVKKGAVVLACKAAIRFLYDKNIPVYYGISMDPGAHIAHPNKVYKAPGVRHIIASSSDPALFEYLKNEKVIIFHSATGLPNEVKLYAKLFSHGDVMGGGYNVVNRALSAALYMGFDKLILAGTDCGWREDEEMYVDGPAHREGVDMSDNGIVEMTDDDGKKLDPAPEGSRIWWTRPDMLASGIALAKIAKKIGEEKFIFLGDVLPAKLRCKTDRFLKQCADFVDNQR